MLNFRAIAVIAALATSADAFAFNRGVPIAAGCSRTGPVTTSQSRSSDTVLFAELLSLQLEKPLGMILEEVEEGEAKGVKVEELADSGSAYASEYRDTLVGLKVATVMGEDVTSISFDDVMAKIIDAPSPVEIEFEIEGGSSSSSAEEDGDTEEEETPAKVVYELGAPVIITVIQDGKETPVEARVGDNLRKTLLANKIELYRGLKKKLGNCGGQGQCTFCAVDFVESEGWEERSEYEDGKIPKWPTARLACMNNIFGPATIKIE